MQRSTRRRLVWGAAFGVTALLVAAGGFVIWLRSYNEDPVNVDEVVERYRGGDRTTVLSTVPANGAQRTDPVEDASEGDAERGSTAPPTTVGSQELPESGVYLYDTTGSEKVDALGGKTHQYPDETAATVTIEDGCVRTRWDALKQRWDENLLCPGAGGWQQEELVTFHSFFRQDERRAYTCEPGSMHVPLDAEPGTVFDGYCESPGSGHSGASTEEVSGEVATTETLDVGGETVDVVKIHYEVTIGGESEGMATVDRWYALDPGPLLVREERKGYTDSETAIGNVHYEEQYEFQLLSMEPMR